MASKLIDKARAATRYLLSHPRELGRLIGDLRDNPRLAARRRLQSWTNGMACNGYQEYGEWLRRYRRTDGEAIERMSAQLRQLAERPLISVIMPTYDTPPRYLRAAIRSVREQIYPHWELCVADDASPNAEVRAILSEEAEREPRIKLTFCAQHGHICAATNAALALASGELVAFLDHDDLLPAHALLVLARTLERHPHLDILYTDEDRIDAEGRRYAPYFKAEWDPELLLAQNCISHLAVFRRRLVEQVGGMREGYEGAQDYDLALRASAATTAERIRHIPHVLYHWRVFPKSSSFLHSAPRRTVDAARRALADHLGSREIKAEIAESPASGYFEIRPAPPQPWPAVTLVVAAANADQGGHLADELRRATDYPRLEIVPAVGRAADALQAVNAAGLESRGDVVAFVSAGLMPLAAEWLRHLVSHLARPAVGAVGAKILNHRNRVAQSALVLGGGAIARSAHRGQPAFSAGYFGLLQLVHRCSAVGVDGLATWGELFREEGGFAAPLSGAVAAADYCLRLSEKGRVTLSVPLATLRGDRAYDAALKAAAEANGGKAEQQHAYMRRWASRLEVDPCYSPNLSLDDGMFGLAEPPRVAPPWDSGRDAARPLAAPAEGDTGQAARRR